MENFKILPMQEKEKLINLMIKDLIEKGVLNIYHSNDQSIDTDKIWAIETIKKTFDDITFVSGIKQDYSYMNN